MGVWPLVANRLPVDRWSLGASADGVAGREVPVTGGPVFCREPVTSCLSSALDLGRDGQVASPRRASRRRSRQLLPEVMTVTISAKAPGVSRLLAI